MRTSLSTSQILKIISPSPISSIPLCGPFKTGSLLESRLWRLAAAVRGPQPGRWGLFFSPPPQCAPLIKTHYACALDSGEGVGVNNAAGVVGSAGNSRRVAVEQAFHRPLKKAGGCVVTDGLWVTGYCVVMSYKDGTSVVSVMFKARGILSQC